MIQIKVDNASFITKADSRLKLSHDMKFIPKRMFESLNIWFYNL